MNRRTAIASLLVTVLTYACADSTEPETFPADGEYVLVAAGGADPFDSSQWSTLPIDYDLRGDSSCVFRLLGGTIAVTGRSYTAELQQEIVTCDAGHAPMTHETGQLARVYEGTAFNGQFVFVADPASVGWLNFAQLIGGELLVALAPPVDSSEVHWLRFRRP